MTLPLASIEQQKVINDIQNDYNVIVDSVAGSGKTTCILHIVNAMASKRILLLTYNAKLRLETREKAKKLKLSNIEVHTYHSFAYKYYHSCKNDLELHNILVKEKECKVKLKFDILILDETQDMTLLYYKLVCRLISDSLKVPQICILGDRYQSIYDFNKADNRFIILGDKLFNFSSNNNWSFQNLSQTFRCTKEMTEFINKCMLGYNRLESNKSNNKPRYIYCDVYGDDDRLYSPYDELVYYLKSGYKPEEIFIIAPSVRSEKTPIRSLENRIKQKMPQIPIYVPISDDEKIDEDILKNKLVFSTFHQVKGLERKVVLVFGFDESYFAYYKKDVNPYVCPNELYVATTRASERLTLFQDRSYSYLPFLNYNKINQYCIVLGSSGIKKEIPKDSRLKPIAVTELLRFCTYDILQECCKFFKTYKIRDSGEFIDIPCKIQQGELYENVSDITGISIPTYFEIVTNKKCTISENLLRMNKIGKKLFEEVLDKLDKITSDKLLHLCNFWNALTSGYFFKLDQIKEYNWLTQELLNKCVDRLKSLGISNKSEFEKEISYNEELTKYELIKGYIDCIDKVNNKVYEFKCVQEIKDEHFIQLALYKLMYETVLEKEQNNNKNQYYLYNILSDELYLLESDKDSLKRMLRILENNKNAQISKDIDMVFIEKTLEHKEKMSKRREKYNYSLADCKNNLFIDLETDGKTIVQISYILTDEKYNSLKEFDKIINTGTIISSYSSMIHGITTEISKYKGVKFNTILEEVKEDFLSVKNIYTHNANFDIGVLKYNLEEIGRYDIVDLIDSKIITCTMKTFKDFVEARDVNGKIKVPKLEELYIRVFGKEIPKNQQHNSLFDSRNLYYIVKELHNKDLLNKYLDLVKKKEEKEENEYNKSECLIDSVVNKDPLKSLKIDELVKLCKEKGLKGYSSLTKDKLVELINNNKEPNKNNKITNYFTKNIN